jgi:hypothetical protein
VAARNEARRISDHRPQGWRSFKGTLVSGDDDREVFGRKYCPFGRKSSRGGTVAIRVQQQILSQISITCEASPNQQEIECRRKIVRQFFNDFWMSTDDKPRTFAERLNRAEDHINEQLAARGETWQLDAAARKQLDLPPSKTV